MYRQSEKKLVKQQYLLHRPYNMVNFGPLAAEIRWRVWDNLQISTGFAFWQRYRTHSSIGRQPNCGVEQRAPPIFGRAAITLGIGPHSSCFNFLHNFFCLVPCSRLSWLFTSFLGARKYIASYRIVTFIRN